MTESRETAELLSRTVGDLQRKLAEARNVLVCAWCGKEQPKPGSDDPAVWQQAMNRLLDEAE